MKRFTLANLVVLGLFINAFGQIEPTPVQEWWCNSSSSPLQIVLSPKKDRLFIVNQSQGTIVSYRLGCVSAVRSQIKIHHLFHAENTAALGPRNGDVFRAESLDDKFFEPKVCSNGKLAVVKASYDTGKFYEIGSQL